MATLAEFLHRTGTGLTEVEVVAAVEDLVGEALTPSDVSPLAATDLAFLREHGGVGDPDPARVRASRARTVAAATALVGESLTGAEVAERLGVDPSRVRHMAADGALYVLRVGRQNRYPRWQFGPDGRPIPGLREVLDLLPADLHPLSVEGFMRTPQPEYELNGHATSAVEWLSAGGDPAVVGAFARWVGADV